MKSTKWFLALSLAAVVLIALTGCKGWRGGGKGSEIDDLVAVTDDDLYGGPLGPRPMGGMQEMERQFEPVYFAYDSSQIQPSERAAIETVADYLRRNPNTGVIVEGHCDERGSREYNLALGERRALAARAYLIGLGIDGSRVQTKSYGEERPIAMGHDEAAWRENRRAEFVLFY